MGITDRIRAKLGSKPANDRNPDNATAVLGEQHIEQLRTEIETARQQGTAHYARASSLARALIQRNAPGDAKEAIKYLTIATGSSENPLVAQDLRLLATLHATLFHKHGNHVDLDAAITAQAMSADHAELDARANNFLGLLYERRYQAHQRIEDLDRAIEFNELAILKIPADEVPSTWLTRQCRRRRMRFQINEDTRDLVEAMATIGAAADRDVARTERVAEELRTELISLAEIWFERFDEGARKSDISQMIRCLEIAAQMNSKEALAPVEYRCKLALAYVSRAKLSTEDTADIDRAKQLLNTAISETPLGGNAFARLSVALGMAHRARFDFTRDMRDLDAAVESFNKAVMTVPPPPGLYDGLHQLGECFFMRYRRRHQRTDLDNSIDVLARAERIAAEDGAADIRLSLTASVYERFLLTENREDLAWCEGLASAGLANEAVNRTLYLHLRGVMSHERFRHDGVLVDLETAIRLLTEATQQPRSELVDPGTLLCDLGYAWHDRFHILGKDEDLDTAVEYLQAATRQSGDSVDWNRRLSVALFTRFVYRGNFDDLNFCIRSLVAALGAADPDGRDHSILQADLAAALEARGQMQNSTEDLDRAIELKDASNHGLANHFATSSASMGHLYHEAELLLDRYQRYGNAIDLQRSISILTRLLSDLPQGHRLYPGAASFIATALRLRYRVACHESDREVGLAWMERALSSIHEQHPERPNVLTNLGRMLIENYSLTADSAVLSQAIDYFAEARQITPKSSPQRPAQHLDLGSALRARYRASKDPSDLGTALDELQNAVALVSDTFWHPLLAEAQFQLALAQRDNGDSDGARASGIAGLVARVIDVLLATNSSDALTTAGEDTAEMAQRIALWCITDGDYATAVQSLELGRSLLLHRHTATATITRLLRDSGAANLAEDWHAAATDHANPSTTDEPFSRSLPTGLRFRAMQALLGVEAGVGSHATDVAPAMKQLTTAPSLDEIAAALLRTGADALVYILPAHVTNDGETDDGVAVILLADRQIVTIPLPGLRSTSADSLQLYMDTYSHTFGQSLVHSVGHQNACSGCQQLERWRTALREICAWAWDAVMGAVAAEVRKLCDIVDNLYLTLVPVGALSVVPWHAAHKVGPDGDTKWLVDDTVITYAASGRMLIDTTNRTAHPRTTRALLVGNPTGDLKGADAEIDALVELYPDAVRLGPEGVDGVPPARSELVLAALPSEEGPGFPIVHLACHGLVGHTAVESRLLLARAEPLTATRLLIRSALRDPKAAGPLVVLSACSTALSWSHLNEAVTLSTSFLAAGASIVIGTLWPINDQVSATIMRRFYELLTTESSPAIALQQTQKFLLKSRHQDPFWWAAFTCHGN